MSNSLPEGWSSVKLSEIADVVSGGTPSRDVAEFWAPADIDWVTPTDITKDSKRTLNESSEKISFKGLRNSSAKTLPVGTILMTSRATLGEMKIAEIECCTNQGFKSLIVKPNVDNWFLYYQMKRKKSCYERLGIGSTFLEVNKKDTDNFEVELAPFKQQQKIAKILTTVDNLIDQTQSLIDKYTAVKQGMMADLFSRGIDLSDTPETNKNYGQLRPSYEDAPELYQETKLGWVPIMWDVEPLSNCLNFLDSQRIPLKQEDRANMGGQYPYYGASGIIDYINDYIFDGTFILLGEDGENVLSRNLPLAFKVTGQIWVNNHAHIMTTKVGMDIDFYTEYLENINYENMVSGSAQPKITQSQLSKMLVKVPPEEEQKEIATRLSSINLKISKEKEYLEKLKLKKKGLMQDLLTGKVKV